MISVNNISYTYPFQDSPALRDVSLNVGSGEAILLAGASGGGKSTFLRLLNGLIPHQYAGRLEGSVSLAGQNMLDMKMREISALVSTLFQDPEKQFLALKVYDEISFALEWRLDDSNELLSRIERVIDDFGLNQLGGASVYELSEGQKQKVALASLAALKPNVLVLDEPTANLDPQSSLELAGHLMRLKQAGTTLVIADHRLAWLEGLIDHVYVIDDGRIVASGQWDMLRDDQLRRRHSLRAIRWPEQIDTTVCDPCDSDALLRWLGLDFSYRGRAGLFDQADIAVPDGCVTAMTGENGCGKTTFARLIAGLVKPRGGILYKRGQVIRPADMLKTTAMAMQNSELQLHQRSCLQELVHAAGDRRRKLDSVSALGWLDRFGLAPLAERHPQSLSGGQKQRLVVACAAVRADDLLILDEPTSGLDAAQMFVLADLLSERSDEGQASLVITHDLELIERVCTHEIKLPLQAQAYGKNLELVKEIK